MKFSDDTDSAVVSNVLAVNGVLSTQALVAAESASDFSRPRRASFAREYRSELCIEVGPQPTTRGPLGFSS